MRVAPVGVVVIVVVDRARLSRRSTPRLEPRGPAVDAFTRRR
jgi:hypothetical protein